DHLLLSGDVTEFGINVNKRDLIIEPEQGKKVTWRCPPGAPPNSKLLLVGSGGAGLQLRGLTLDGNNHTEALVTLFGKCAGVKLENLDLRNTKRYGLLIMNCEGTNEQPVQLSDLTFQTQAGQTAIRFDWQKQLVETARQTRFVHFRDCR